MRIVALGLSMLVVIVLSRMTTLLALYSNTPLPLLSMTFFVMLIFDCRPALRASRPMAASG